MTDKRPPIPAAEEGSAASADAIADELSKMVAGFDRLDYNAVTHPELQRLLAARCVIEGLCLRYREVQQRHAREDSGGEDT